METAIAKHGMALNKYVLFLEEMDEILLILDQKIVPIIDPVKLYLAGNITKRDLANKFAVVEVEILYPILQLGYVASRLNRTALQLRLTLENTLSYYKAAYQTLWDLKIPVYTYTRLWESPLWRELLEPSNNSTLQTIISDITEQKPRPIKFHDMFDILFEPFLSYPSEQGAAIGNASKEFSEVMISYYNNLKRYREELIVDNTFYL